MTTKAAATTPMMAQFLEIKERHPDSLLFYRMGDFYEMFFDDAVNAAEALDIALTKRGKHNGEDIPMCGVPVHAAEGYFLTLIRKGFRVAVCEQLESPAEAKKRGYKAVVKRDVVRMVTPGTLTEDSLLEARRHNYLAAYSSVRDNSALAWVDISTGAMAVMSIDHTQLSPELARLSPSEVLIREEHLDDWAELETDLGLSLTPIGNAAFDSANAERRLLDLYEVGSLDAFGQFDRAEISALGAIVEYLEITQKGKLPLLRSPMKETSSKTMQIDASTRRNLEISASLNGARAGSLIATIDRTVTSAGARLLERRISSPSCVADTIHDRLNAVTDFVESSLLRRDIREVLRSVPDIERALSRLSLERGGPRDLASIRDALTCAFEIHETVSKVSLSGLLETAKADFIGHNALIELLESAIVADPPLLSRDGGFIASQYNAELDECRTLRDEGRSVIAGLQAQYSEITGVAALKIKHNNVLGYFIETPATHAKKMLGEPLSETFIHRQTTANAVRFTTVELSELETKIINAGARALEIEKQIFEQLRSSILEKAPEIHQTSRGIAEFDLSAAFADIAVSENWTRAKIDNSLAFEITGGRHPVVENALKKQNGSPFVANDCDLSEQGIWLLTGPNMAGKSTFLRQNALIALLAQAGSYVPAAKAHIGIVSQLFSRVGASDDLARGRSTFMVEMVETAAILNQSDDRALVILDEIGRGTATYDGLSIAWATLEHLHDVNKSRALFATHYHEITALSKKLDRVDNATVAVKEWEGDVIFLHEVIRGAADRSYGVQVAKLAGLPPSVVERAKQVLDVLEKGDREGDKKSAVIDDLPLFSSTPPPKPVIEKSNAMSDKMDSILPDELTPREALALIYELKDLAKE